MGIRIVLGDRHRYVRRILRQILELEPDLVVTGEADNGRETLRMTEDLSPDVVALCACITGLPAAAVVKGIHRAHADVKVLVMSMRTDSAAIQQMLHAGANGFMLKDGAATELAEAIRRIAAGQIYLSPGLTIAEECLPEED